MKIRSNKLFKFINQTRRDAGLIATLIITGIIVIVSTAVVTLLVSSLKGQSNLLKGFGCFFVVTAALIVLAEKSEEGVCNNEEE